MPVLFSPSHWKRSHELKGATNVAITIPPLAGIRSSTSSGTLRGWSQMDEALECEKTTGETETSRTARMVPGETCA